ncbi:MAG TPA: sigma-70 family RNA polymerase sigma factor [Archangium sp.]|uniref:RNA polymerase sigma factor n=1 Tax=Archangium sp. TaxID=1872627 RepID=UPI002E309A70|nr:sigma-70 family RNA polymerase sigma factor [Archangium sp.]HEX5751016.1 sigma-70 family RNA polymerase sigma factor [Archangium sp.]
MSAPQLAPVSPPLSAEAVADVLLAHRRTFLGFLRKRMGGGAAAEDVLQEALVRALTRLPLLEDEQAVLRWFYRALRNALVDQHRRHEAASRALEALAREPEEVGVPDASQRQTPCGCVTRLATSLKPEYARALERVEVEGIAVKDFAAEQGLSRGNAAVRAFRAREALRRQVSSTCGACADEGCQDCSCGEE